MAVFTVPPDARMLVLEFANPEGERRGRDAPVAAYFFQRARKGKFPHALASSVGSKEPPVYLTGTVARWHLHGAWTGMGGASVLPYCWAAESVSDQPDGNRRED